MVHRLGTDFAFLTSAVLGNRRHPPQPTAWVLQIRRSQFQSRPMTLCTFVMPPAVIGYSKQSVEGAPGDILGSLSPVPGETRAHGCDGTLDFIVARQ
jgi:hypothetical protein